MITILHEGRSVTVRIRCNACGAEANAGQWIHTPPSQARCLWPLVRNAALGVRGLLMMHGWGLVAGKGDDEPPVRDLCPACLAKAMTHPR